MGMFPVHTAARVFISRYASGLALMSNINILVCLLHGISKPGMISCLLTQRRDVLAPVSAHRVKEVPRYDGDELDFDVTEFHEDWKKSVLAKGA